MAELLVEPIPCLQDNYAYLIRSPATGEGWLVDPPEPGPPRRALAEHPDLRLRGILATHHHGDHVAGIEALVADARDGPIWVAAHARDRGRIRGQTIFVDAPRRSPAVTELVLAGTRLRAMHVPGHTRGAIAWCVPGVDGEIADVFTGDTLFAAGCGRLFEGTPAEMFASLESLGAFPDGTRLWFGHEYTAKNLEFAAHAEPTNPEITRRRAAIGSVTTPTTVGEERATNPFLRAHSVEEFASRRHAKDRF